MYPHFYNLFIYFRVTRPSMNWPLPTVLTTLPLATVVRMLYMNLFAASLLAIKPKTKYIYVLKWKDARLSTWDPPTVQFCQPNSQHQGSEIKLDFFIGKDYWSVERSTTVPQWGKGVRRLQRNQRLITLYQWFHQPLNLLMRYGSRTRKW